jgi:hypothetical protein
VFSFRRQANEATKKQATEFAGKALRAAKILRQQLLPVMPLASDNKMQSRLVKKIVL